MNTLCPGFAAACCYTARRPANVTHDCSCFHLNPLRHLLDLYYLCCRLVCSSLSPSALYQDRSATTYFITPLHVLSISYRSVTLLLFTPPSKDDPAEESPSGGVYLARISLKLCRMLCSRSLRLSVLHHGFILPSTSSSHSSLILPMARKRCSTTHRDTRG